MRVESSTPSSTERKPGVFFVADSVRVRGMLAGHCRGEVLESSRVGRDTLSSYS